MVTALVLFGILAVCAFLEWIVMIPLAGRDRMKAWKEVDPQGWGHFKLLMGFPFLAVLIVVVMINFGLEKNMDKTLKYVLMAVSALIVFAGCSSLIALVIKKKGNEASKILRQRNEAEQIAIQKEKRAAEIKKEQDAAILREIRENTGKESVTATRVEGGKIRCSACGEVQPGNRSICWNCGAKLNIES
ncbi:MAG: hypothetical protein II117_02385 [Clostridia bacterium]|nr:hypothetical protein [Clostridia bacterium]